MSPIFFLRYISGVFNIVAETSPLVTFFYFIDDLGFIALGRLVKKIVKVLEKVAQEVIKWGRLNIVTYDISKTEAVLFS